MDFQTIIEQIISGQSLAILTVIIFALLIVFELLWPERDYPNKSKKVSYITNLFVFLINNIVLVVVRASALFGLAYIFREQLFSNITIFDFAALPLWLELTIGILILDFVMWFWHLLNHKSEFLWRFHKCHHSEQYLNASSALRFHIFELLLSVIFKIGVILLFGISIWIFFLYEALVTIFAGFHHSNITLSKRVQNIIGMIIITPDMHRTHHSTLRVEHDNNYGVIFSWWDKLCQTFSTVTPRKIGLHDISEKKLTDFIVFPFKKK